MLIYLFWTSVLLGMFNLTAAEQQRCLPVRVRSRKAR
jgi:hypothetical protein